MLGAAGAGLGSVLGMIVARFERRMLIRIGFVPNDFAIAWRPWIVAVSAGVGLGVAALGSLVAARRASRVGPLEAVQAADGDERIMTVAAPAHRSRGRDRRGRRAGLGADEPRPERSRRVTVLLLRVGRRRQCALARARPMRRCADAPPRRGAWSPGPDRRTRAGQLRRGRTPERLDRGADRHDRRLGRRTRRRRRCGAGGYPRRGDAEPRWRSRLAHQFSRRRSAARARRASLRLLARTPSSRAWKWRTTGDRRRPSCSRVWPSIP